MQLLPKAKKKEPDMKCCFPSTMGPRQMFCNSFKLINSKILLDEKKYLVKNYRWDKRSILKGLAKRPLLKYASFLKNGDFIYHLQVFNNVFFPSHSILFIFFSRG
jgi:hypothetical protein